MKVRCSSNGKIISKSGKLTQTGKTYLQELFTQEKRGVKKEIISKYLEKGTATEEQDLELLNRNLYSNTFVFKNEERRENKYISGEFDVLGADKILYDVKNAWDWLTFDKVQSLSWDYEWQVKGYLWLWGLKKGRIFYCLNNMPEHMLDEMERKMFYANHFASYEDPEYIELCEELRYKHNYDRFSDAERFKIFDIELKDEDIEKMISCHKQAQDYYKELESAEKSRITFNQSLINKAKKQ